MVHFAEDNRQLLRLAPSGPQPKREAAAGRLAIEGVSLIVELFESHARGVERADGLLLEEIEQARACMSCRLIRSSVADGPDELGLAAGVNIEETLRDAPLRFCAEPSESFAAHAPGLERLPITHRL